MPIALRVRSSTGPTPVMSLRSSAATRRRIEQLLAGGFLPRLAASRPCRPAIRRRLRLRASRGSACRRPWPQRWPLRRSPSAVASETLGARGGPLSAGRGFFARPALLGRAWSALGLQLEPADRSGSGRRCSRRRRAAGAAAGAGAGRRRWRRERLVGALGGRRFEQRRAPPCGAENARSICGPGLIDCAVAGLERVDDFLEALDRQVLIGVVADHDHRRVDAGAEALDLFPAQRAVVVDVERIVVDPVLADGEQILGAAQHAGRRAADHDVGLGAHRLQQELRVERRDFEHADIGHAQHACDISIAARVTQPSCSWARHSSGITADCWRPAGYWP